MRTRRRRANDPVPLSVLARGDAYDRLVERLTRLQRARHRTIELGIAEAEHATIGADEPVAPTVGRGRDAHDRRRQEHAAHGTVERRPVGEDAAVRPGHPVAAGRRAGDADHRRIAGGHADVGGVPERADAPAALCQPVAPVGRRRRHRHVVPGIGNDHDRSLQSGTRHIAEVATRRHRGDRGRRDAGPRNRSEEVVRQRRRVGAVWRPLPEDVGRGLAGQEAHGDGGRCTVVDHVGGSGSRGGRDEADDADGRVARLSGDGGHGRHLEHDAAQRTLELRRPERDTARRRTGGCRRGSGRQGNGGDGEGAAGDGQRGDEASDSVSNVDPCSGHGTLPCWKPPPALAAYVLARCRRALLGAGPQASVGTSRASCCVPGHLLRQGPRQSLGA